MHEAGDAPAGASELLHEAFLTNPLHDLCTALINLDDFTKLAGWDSARIVRFGVHGPVELRLKNIERSIIEPSILDLTKGVSIGEHALELDS
jgi:hypothetical protein